jgi:hypothetical protein
MEGICGVSNSDLAANWVGAIGSAGAAILAVALYWHDKRATAKRELEARKVSRHGQALQIAVLLDAMQSRLQFLEEIALGKVSNPCNASLMKIPEPVRLIEVLTDAEAFTPKELSPLYSFVVLATNINQRIEGSPAARGNPGANEPNGFTAVQVQAAISISNGLSVAMWNAGTQTEVAKAD